MNRWLLPVALLGATAAAGAAARAGPAQDYALHCMGCHGASAQGVPGKVPPLAHSLVRFMNNAEGRRYVLRVPGAANSMLSDAQLAAVLNWVVAQFDADELGSATPQFREQEVAANRHTPMAGVLATRAAVLKEIAAIGPAPATEY
ncbi:MAG TPA: cytochrome c [Steroidobacteraceae bacterium]|nr:cytochrome c [Steroidobacteraceae bacterium]